MFWLCAAFYDVKKSTILHLYLTQKRQDLICGKSSADKDVGYKTLLIELVGLVHHLGRFLCPSSTN
ncbi:hypothetical protein [Fusobacterium pseudoperiodonticum]|uniref:hypothetical protein n=1 Tax=Fusobacterium pseudoperiodonticum TaxID=2663009 RepID=UPI001181A5D0|nr:hypothetical protein [Fusobacterium pseudoperiodonticum]